MQLPRGVKSRSLRTLRLARQTPDVGWLQLALVLVNLLNMARQPPPNRPPLHTATPRRVKRWPVHVRLCQHAGLCVYILH